MPDKDIMTLEEFLQAKADSTRNAAYEKSKNRKVGIKIKYPLTEERKIDNEEIITNYLNDVNRLYSPLRLDEEEAIINDYSTKRYLQALEENKNNCEYGLNCIGTSTDNYPESSQTNVNADFKENHGKYGFVQIPFAEVLKGDIVQAINNKRGLINNPFHGMIFAGYNDNGNPLFNYSSGGITEYDYKINGRFPNKEGYLTYRYVGTPELIQQWTNEYNQKKLGGMKKVRQKKVIGGIVSAVGSIASSIINSHNQAKSQREQQEANILAQNQENTALKIANMNQLANNDLTWVYDRFKPSFRCGGKKRIKANLGKYKPRFGK